MPRKIMNEFSENAFGHPFEEIQARIRNIAHCIKYGLDARLVQESTDLFEKFGCVIEGLVSAEIKRQKEEKR